MNWQQTKKSTTQNMMGTGQLNTIQQNWREARKLKIYFNQFRCFVIKSIKSLTLVNLWNSIKKSWWKISSEPSVPLAASASTEKWFHNTALTKTRLIVIWSQKQGLSEWWHKDGGDKMKSLLSHRHTWDGGDGVTCTGCCCCCESIVFNVCFDITIVVVFWRDSWWSTGDLGGRTSPNANDSAALTMSSTWCTRTRQDELFYNSTSN